MMQSTCHHHLAVRCTLVLTTSPDVLPWLRFCFRGWISVSPNTAEEIFAGDSLHGFFIMRSDYDSGQRCQAFWGGEGGSIELFDASHRFWPSPGLRRNLADGMYLSI